MQHKLTFTEINWEVIIYEVLSETFLMLLTGFINTPCSVIYTKATKGFSQILL